MYSVAKIARVRISKEYLETVLRADGFVRPNSVITSNAPKDLEVLGLAFPKDVFGYPHTFEIYVKSESFEDIPEGTEPPLLEPFVYHAEELNFWVFNG